MSNEEKNIKTELQVFESDGEATKHLHGLQYHVPSLDTVNAYVEAYGEAWVLAKLQSIIRGTFRQRVAGLVRREIEVAEEKYPGQSKQFILDSVMPKFQPPAIVIDATQAAAWQPRAESTEALQDKLFAESSQLLAQGKYAEAQAVMARLIELRTAK